MITSIISKLPFINKQETISFYVNKLGFELVADYGDYLILECDTVEIHFFTFPTLVTAASDFMIYLRIDRDIEDFYKTLQEKGITIHPNGKLETKPWQQIDFSIIDPNGTLLTFGQAI